MGGVNVDYLTWDSDFFGFSVGRVVLADSKVDPNVLKSAIREAGNKLTYVFLPVGDDADRSTERPRSALVDLGGKCCDLKVTYRKAIDVGALPSFGESFSATCVSPALEALAYASGWCSRFVADERLEKFFKAMYLIWLKNDLDHGKVFVRPSVDAPEGMATVSVYNGLGKVGLVAVDAKSCGKGIATSLLHDVDRYLLSQGVQECEVVTQGTNLAARHLYEKVGFKLLSQFEVWHIWADNDPRV